MISRVEHPAIRTLCSHLGTQGYQITELPWIKMGFWIWKIWKKA